MGRSLLKNDKQYSKTCIFVNKKPSAQTLGAFYQSSFDKKFFECNDAHFWLRHSIRQNLYSISKHCDPKFNLKLPILARDGAACGSSNNSAIGWKPAVL